MIGPRTPAGQAAEGRDRGLNCQMQFDHSMPFGGYKQSGWGYESGKAGIETYLQTKIVWAQM